MATAEARAAWQRTANRYFVQEDAKRAPKLASARKQVDFETSEMPDRSVAGFVPLNRNPFSSKSRSSDPGLYVRMQPSYVFQKGLAPEQLDASVEDIDIVNYDDLMEMSENSVSEKQNEYCFDTDNPWWRAITDKDELASMVASKSLDYVENCDLPPTPKVHIRKQLYGSSRSFGSDQKSRSCGISTPIIRPDYVSTPKQERDSVEDGYNLYTCDESSSYSYSTKEPETQSSENVLSKAQLLEALRHSQTRAREAEKAAKEAQADKDHIIKLFFKQASQLFAYKQWLRLLQVESLYLQIKNNDKKPKKRQRHDFWDYAFAFSLGLSLVGAGLFLGWTAGWLLLF